MGLDKPYAFCYNSKATRPVGQAAKTPPSQGGNMGSIPVRVTTKKKALAFASAFFVVCGLLPHAARYRFAVTGALRRVILPSAVMCRAKAKHYHFAQAKYHAERSEQYHGEHCEQYHRTRSVQSVPFSVFSQNRKKNAKALDKIGILLYNIT